MARRLVDGVWELDSGVFSPFATNVFLIDERPDGPVTLVDAGLPLNRPRLRAELDGLGLAPTDVDQVLVTHYDIDHVGGITRLRGFVGPVYMGADDVRLVRREWHPQWFHHKGTFHRIVRRLFPMAEVDLRPVEDGDRIGNFQAFHTPGHNPGHTAYVHEKLGVSFLGDLVWEEDGEFTPPFWLDSYDMHELRESIRDFVDRSPPCDVACAAHGSPMVGEGDDALGRLAARL